MKKWNVLGVEQVVKDKWIDVRAENCLTGHGVAVNPFYTYHPRDWVLIAAQTKDEKWIVVRQYRHGLKDFDFEFPAGNCESEDTPLKTAMRELIEETGFGNGSWKHLRSWPFNTANHTNKVHAFLVKNVEKIAEPELDENEEIEVLFWTTEQLQLALAQETLQHPIHQLLGYMLFANENLSVL